MTAGPAQVRDFAHWVETLIAINALAGEAAATVRQALGLAPLVPQSGKDVSQTLLGSGSDHITGRRDDIRALENGEGLILGRSHPCLAAPGVDSSLRHAVVSLGEDRHDDDVDGPVCIHSESSSDKVGASPAGTHRTTPATTPFQRWNGEAWTPDSGGNPMNLSEPPRIPSPPLAPSHREDKFIGHDGAIWPFARHLMQDVNTIRRRMAEDVADIVAGQPQDPTVAHEDLTRLGWTRGQVLAHGDHAIRAAMRVE